MLFVFLEFLFPDVTAIPICWEPVSIPIVTGCVAQPVLYSNLIVNGYFL